MHKTTNVKQDECEAGNAMHFSDFFQSPNKLELLNALVLDLTLTRISSLGSLLVILFNIKF
jgi:hypothetical protein